MDSFIMDDVYKLKYVRLVIKNIKLGQCRWEKPDYPFHEKAFRIEFREV